jgi:phage shock protein B
MSAVFIVAIVFAGIVLSLAVIGGTILMGIKLKHGGLSAKEKQAQSDEARIIQELYYGLNRMEQRIEALETLLMDGKKEE